MDDDGFTQVKKKERRQGNPQAGGRQAASGQHSHRRSGQHANKPHTHGPAGRGARGAQDSRQPYRTRPVGPGARSPTHPTQSAGNLTQSVQANKKFVSNPAMHRAGTPHAPARQGANVRAVNAADLVSAQPSQNSSHAPSDVKQATAAPKRVQGICYAQIVAEQTSRKSDTASVLSVHSTAHTPTTVHDNAASPFGQPANVATASCITPGATTGKASTASTPSAMSTHTSAARPPATSFAEALGRSGSGKWTPTQKHGVKASLPRTAAGNKHRLPAASKCPTSGHPSLRVNTTQHLLAKSCTSLDPSSTSGAPACDAASFEAPVDPVPVELVSLVTPGSEASAAHVEDAGPPTASVLHRLMKPVPFENPNNLCFLTATLQALLSTQCFAQLLASLLKVKDLIPARLGVLNELAQLAADVESPTDQLRTLKSLTDIVDVYNKAEGFKREGTPLTVASNQPQLDAALLFTTLIDLAAEQLSTVLQELSPDNAFMATSQDDRDRHSVTLQPFTMLHVRPLASSHDTVEAALSRLFARSVDDSKDAGVHQTLILELPKVLVVHVARASILNREAVKVSTPVHHPMQLDVKRDWFAASAPVKSASYNLVAKVRHQGAGAKSGHYTTIARRIDAWVSCNDASLSPASGVEVMEPDGYMLFYEMAN